MLLLSWDLREAFSKELIVMNQKKLRIAIYILVLILIKSLILSTAAYAEENQLTYGYNPEINFSKSYEYQLTDYSFLNKEEKLLVRGFIQKFASINQSGNLNQSSIVQSGILGSIVEVIQIGNENSANIRQLANFTKAEVFQFGNNHDLEVEQWGAKGKLYVIQSGNNFENKEIKILQF